MYFRHRVTDANTFLAGDDSSVYPAADNTNLFIPRRSTLFSACHKSY